LSNRTLKNSYHHGDLRQALLEAGDSVLRDLGLRKFTLRECARRANVSHSAPKHHFGDVRGLLTELAAGGFVRLTELLRQELVKATNLHEEFAATTRAYLNFAVENPEHFRIMFRSDLIDELSPVLVEAANSTFIELTNVIHRQRGEPEIIPEGNSGHRPLREIANDIVISWSHIHGFAHLVLEQQLNMVEESEYEKLIVAMARRLSDMLQADAQK
jgi:AcrR family transcriptional regulator